MTLDDAIQGLHLQRARADSLARSKRPVPAVEYDTWLATTCTLLEQNLPGSERFLSVLRSHDRNYILPEFPDAELGVVQAEALRRQARVLTETISYYEERSRGDSVGRTEVPAVTKPVCVFIGHGQSQVWGRVNTLLRDELKLPTVYFERESRTSLSSQSVLQDMLARATFAVLVLTAEDETTGGSKRARQNVIHEAGLFQGRLGVEKAVLLQQTGVEELSNLAGLQHIPFVGDRIQDTFYELQRVLRREKHLP